MLKIGILSFAKKSNKEIKDLIEKQPLCKLLGTATCNKLQVVDDSVKSIITVDELVDLSDIIVLDSASSENMDVIFDLIKKYKHLYFINTGKFTHQHTSDILKLIDEAGVHCMFSQPHRMNPLINYAFEHINSISFINITENGYHNETDNLIYNKLLEKIDILLMFMRSNIYRISACSSSDEFINIRLEFNSAINANITINQLAETNCSTIEILSPGENVKIDLLRNELYKINKTRKCKLVKEEENLKDIDSIVLLEKEFYTFVNQIFIGEDLDYDIQDYLLANAIADDVLKKISYVLT